MRAVIDTNVLVSALINSRGTAARIIDFVTLGQITPVYDDRIIAEYREVLSRPKFNFRAKDIHAVVNLIEAGGESVVVPSLNLDLPDNDDAPFLEVASGAACDYLITGNIKHFPKIVTGEMNSTLPDKIVSPAEFLEKSRTSIKPALEQHIEANSKQNTASDGMNSIDNGIMNSGELSKEDVVGMGSDDPEIRVRTMIQLEKSDDPKARDYVIAALDDNEAFIRRRAAELLGFKKERRAVEKLMSVLEDKDSAVRSSAAFALGEIGDQTAIDALRKVAQMDSDSHCRQMALRSLKSLSSS